MNIKNFITLDLIKILNECPNSLSGGNFSNFVIKCTMRECILQIAIISGFQNGKC